MNLNYVEILERGILVCSITVYFDLPFGLQNTAWLLKVYSDTTSLLERVIRYIFCHVVQSDFAFYLKNMILA